MWITCGQITWILNDDHFNLVGQTILLICMALQVVIPSVTSLKARMTRQSTCMSWHKEHRQDRQKSRTTSRVYSSPLHPDIHCEVSTTLLMSAYNDPSLCWMASLFDQRTWSVSKAWEFWKSWELDEPDVMAWRGLRMGLRAWVEL